MILHPLTATSSRRALLFFAGWGMDPRPFSALTVGGYDVWLVYDYTDAPLDTAPLVGYDEVVVAAWSYGVAMAAVALEGTSLPVTRRVAINGTMHPIDRRRGIPEVIFMRTLAGLNAETLADFNVRMTGSLPVAERFEAIAPSRSIESLRAELEAIGNAARRGVPPFRWDEAVIASHDRIIPTEAQRHAWIDGTATIVTEIAGNHWLDFDDLLPHLIVDKSLVASRFERSASSYDLNASVQQLVAERLADLVLPLLPDGARIFEAGAGTGTLTRLLAASPRVAAITAVDIADVMKPVNSTARVDSLIADAEVAIKSIKPGSYDAFISASAMQWFNSPRLYLERAADVIPPGGIVAFATYGARNFVELDSLIPRRRRFPDMEQWAEMLPPSLKLLHASSETIVSRFDSPTDILRHMKHTGVNAVFSTLAPTAFIRNYPPSNTLTYNPVWLLAQKTNALTGID